MKKIPETFIVHLDLLLEHFTFGSLRPVDNNVYDDLAVLEQNECFKKKNRLVQIQGWMYLLSIKCQTVEFQLHFNLTCNAFYFMIH